MGTSPYLSSGKGTGVAGNVAPGVNPGWDTTAGKGQNSTFRMESAPRGSGDDSIGALNRFYPSETHRGPSETPG